MHHEIRIKHQRLSEARSVRGFSGRRVDHWGRFLASQRAIERFHCEEIFHDLTPWPGGFDGPKVVTALTDAEPFLLLRHPGRKREALGGDYYDPAAVGYALVVLSRLGVPVDLRVLESLIKRLRPKRQQPLLSHDELRLLWSGHETNRTHTFTWSDDLQIVADCYAQSLHDGRVLFGFADPDGRRVEVVADKPSTPKFYREALARGFQGSRPDFRQTISEAAA